MADGHLAQNERDGLAWSRDRAAASQLIDNAPPIRMSSGQSASPTT